MTLIRGVFSADSIELNDLRADPNTVIKIQSLIKEMLEANDNRRLGIRRTILQEYGTYALPGIISTTYVLSDRLANKRNQELISELMVELCRGNIAAQRLLLRSGIIESPFDASREIASAALVELGEFDYAAEANWLPSEAVRLAKEDERAGALALFELLLKHDLAVKEAIDACRQWFASDYEASKPAKLMNLLLLHQPDKTEDILATLFDALERTDDEAGREIRAVVDLANPDAILPAFRASSKRLDRERSGRAKPVEFLFEGAIARQIVKHPDCIPMCSQFIQTESLHDAISRYWWQALSSAVKQEPSNQDVRRYFDTELAQIEDENFALWGYVQLMFLKSGSRGDKSVKDWAAQTLQDLNMSNPDLYAAADDMRDRLSNSTPISGKERKRTGNTLIS